MYTYKWMYVLTLAGMLVSSCNKTSGPVIVPAATLNVVNAAANLGAVQVNYQNIPVIWKTYTGNVNYGSNMVFTVSTGSPIATIVVKSDTTLKVYNQSIPATAGGIYSLFLGGLTSAGDTVVDPLMVQDNPPYHGASDSTIGIRFVNMLYNSNGVSVNLAGKANGSEASGLAYKGLTSFMNYSAHYKDSSYTFVFRNATTGDSLTKYTMSNVYYGSGTNLLANSYRFRNVTIMIYGNAGGSPAPAANLINNY